MHDAQMEKTVLGAMLLNSEAFAVGRELEPSDFYLDSNRRIFGRMLAMHAAGTAVDSSTLTSELKRTVELETVGGIGYVMDLTDGLPFKFNPASYVKILRKHATTRKIINLCSLMQSRAEGGDDPEAILAELSAGALQSQMASTDVRPVHIREYIVPSLQEMQRQRDSPRGVVLGISSGIPDLDLCTTGWRDGELTYVGALPGRGKTSFMLQAMYAAAVAGIGVGCISLEMQAAQLVRRLTIIHSRLPAQSLRDTRNLTPEHYAHAKKSMLALGDLPISITDVSGLNPAQIASQARQMHKDGARIIFVDFVQIIREDGKERREAINRVSASLRDTCKALNIPFVVASQLARRDADPNRRPTIQDLRESGNLEQDAHNVLLLYRPKDKATGDWTGEDEIIIDKQREGVTGVVRVTYDEHSLTYKPRGFNANGRTT
jgi:replicative DNA helicase